MALARLPMVHRHLFQLGHSEFAPVLGVHVGARNPHAVAVTIYGERRPVRLDPILVLFELRRTEIGDLHNGDEQVVIGLES